MSYLLRVLPYLKPHKRLAATTLLSVVLIAAANLLAPWPMKILVDSVLGDHPLPGFLAIDFLTNNVYVMVVMVVTAGFLVVLLQNALNVLREYVNTRLKLKITLDFRGDLFQHAQRLSLAYHDSTYSGKLVYLLNNQADAVAGLLMTLPVLAQSVLTFVGMFVILSLIDRGLALAALVVLPFLFYSVKVYASRVQGPLHKVKELESQTLSMIQEAMSMLRVVVAFGRERYEWRRFRDQGEEAINARVDVTVRQSLFELLVNLITAAGLALVVGLGAMHILQGTLTLGVLLVVMAYMSSIYLALGTISSTVGALQDQVVSLQRAFVTLDTEPDVRDSCDAVEAGQLKGGVVFEDVHFSYDENSETLKNLSFAVKPGEYVAIVGPTGAGKTTLVSLIPRFYDPARGRILVDGKDSYSFTLQSLRSNISIVGQEPILFVGSIADNIRYGRLDASDEEIMRAARDANVHEFIMQLPLQYETEIGERGARLSGGERQRIAVARAFLKDSPILILDEPTAFVDPKTEKVVLDAVRKLRQGRSVFMISHRISTIRDADKIVVLNEGRIVEIGTHAELSAHEGLYRQLSTINSQ